MPTVDLIDVKGKKSGSVDLPEALFDATTNVPLIHQVVTAQLAAAPRELSQLFAEVKFLVLVRSRSSRRELVVLVRVRSVCLSTAVVELFTVQSHAITTSAHLRR